MQLQFIDSSLARGLARQSVRELRQGSTKRVKLKRAGSSRRGARFRAIVAAVRKAWAGRIARELGDSDQWLCFCWDAIQDPVQQRIELFGIQVRSSRSKGVEVLSSAPLVIVSEHAISRLHQRLQSTDINESLRELDRVANTALHMRLHHREGSPNDLEIPTERGIAIGLWTGEHMLVKTWLSARNLAPERRERRNQSLWEATEEDFTVFEIRKVPA